MTESYPFAAIIGQDELKRALLVCAVNPAVGGVLIRGEKGTAKSTAVRGLAELLPEIQVVRGCSFSLEPSNQQEACPYCTRCRNGYQAAGTKRPVQVINLPLNATEDRVAGGIDFAATVSTGRPVLQPGLLAQAHRGILYVDEVNLLDDHIVDLVLDAAASGMNIIEREGISLSHPSQFTLIGTMNPEEGELRPQFLDRFGLCVEVRACQDIEDRVRLVEQRERFDNDPAGFRGEFREETRRLRQTISEARRQLALVHLDSTVRSFIANLCMENHVAGHRADLVMEQAARTVAALEGASRVTGRHVREIAAMVLVHRLRDASPPPAADRPGQEDSQEDSPDMDRKQDGPQHVHDADTSDNQGASPESVPQDKNESQSPAEDCGQQDIEDKGGETNSSQGQDMDDEGSSSSFEQVFDIGPQFRVRRFSVSRDRVVRRGSGRRSRSRVSQKQGRYTRAGLNGVHGDIALDATIRAAAPFQKARGGSLMINLCPEDFRYRIRERRLGNLLLFIVDASGSMGARGRMAATKGAVMSLLLDAYQKRDKVAMVSFRRDSAWLNLPVTGSVELAGKLLAEMPVGGRTPLSAGLAKGYEQLRNYFSKEPWARPIVIIITDGKCNVSIGKERPVDEMLKMASAMGKEKRATYIVVDTEEEGVVTFDLASRLAAALGGSYFKIKDLQAEELVHIVRGNQIR